MGHSYQYKNHDKRKESTCSSSINKRITSKRSILDENRPILTVKPEINLDYTTTFVISEKTRCLTARSLIS